MTFTARFFGSALFLAGLAATTATAASAQARAFADQALLGGAAIRYLPGRS